MHFASDAYTQLEQSFAEWALTQPAIRAVIVVGSRARSDHPADEWSDLDLVVFAIDAAPYLQDSTWLNSFGDVIAASSSAFGAHDQEWIALYADGCKLDAAILSIDPAASRELADILDQFPYPVVLQRGVRVLVDRSGTPARQRLSQVDAPRLPTQAEFNALINRLLLDAIKAAKFIRRADLWRAKLLCDGAMKQHLLTLLEWQSAAPRDRRDIWYDGRFLEEWADREALIDLPGTFAAYSAEDLQRALFATLDLSRRLAYDVAKQLGYDFPTHADQFVVAQIRAISRGSA
jgi:aminoglycoside 6-adenylyltransferase